MWTNCGPPSTRSTRITGGFFWGRADGDADAVTAGNAQLLLREQHDVIDASYQKMHAHSPSGYAMTYLMAAVGEPSIPGAHGFAEYRPFTESLTTSGPARLNVPDLLPGPNDYDNPAQFEATLTTPLPGGNIAGFNGRWALVTNDTLPAFQDLLQTDPAGAREIVASDVSTRIDHYRLSHRIDGLLGRYATDWHLRVDQ